MRTTCKQCWKEMSKHYITMRKNFCSKECNKIWVKKHSWSKSKRKRMNEQALMGYGLSSSACDKSSVGEK